MANYSKEEKEKKVQEALNARSNKAASNPLAAKKKEQDDKINQALQAREQKVQSTLPDTFSEIQSRYKKAADSYNSTQAKYNDYDNVYASQRESRIELGKLRNKINAYSRYMDQKTSKALLEGLEQMERGYDEALSMASFTNEEEYLEAQEYKAIPDFVETSGKGWQQYLDDQQKKREENKRTFWDIWLEANGATAAPDASFVGQTIQNAAYQNKLLENAVYGPMDNWSEEQKKIYGYLYGTDQAKANAYAKAVIDRKGIANLEQTAKEYPVAASGLSVLTSVASGEEYLEDLVKTAQDRAKGGTAQLGKNYYTQATNAIRGSVMEEVDWKIKNWDAFDFLYSTAMSGADSLAAGAVFGKASGAVLGLSAAAQATNDALERGLDSDKAFWNGLLSGAAEALFESLSIGNLRAMKEVAPDGIKEIIKNIGKSMLVNASEEALTEITNIAYDTLANGELANITKEEFMNGGWKEALYQVLEAGASGALMGFGFGTIGNVGGYVNERTVQNDAYKAELAPRQAEILAKALENNPENRFANRMKERVDSGKELSGRQLYNLEQQNKEAEARTAESETTQSQYTNTAEEAQSEQETEDIQTGTEAVEQANTEYKPLIERVGEEGRFNVAESGEAVVRESGKKVDLENFEVTKLEDGEMTIKPEGGEEVYAGDIDFATGEQSHAFSGVADMEGMTAHAATEMIKAIDLTKPVGAQLNGLDEAFTYGRSGYSLEDLKAGDFVGDLTDEQMMKAYNLGKELRKSNAEKDAPAVKMRTAAEAKLTQKQKTEKQKNRFQGEAEVYFMDRKTKTVKKFDEAGVEYDEKRMAGVNAAKFLSRLGIGKKYYFYESYTKDGKMYYVDENGVEKLAPNGIYKTGTGTFYIDLNAGDKGQGVTLFTLAHELTHFVKDQSKSQFQRLADIVKEAYDKTDLSLHERTVRRQNEMAANQDGKHVSYDDAYEEVICDALSTMMADGSFYEQLADIKVKDRKLFNSIKKFFQKIISRFQDIYDKLTPDQRDARDIREMKAVFDKLQRAFAEALVEASDNFQAAMESVVEAKAEPISTDEIITDGAVVTDGQGVKHSIRSMKQDIAEGKEKFSYRSEAPNDFNPKGQTLEEQLNEILDTAEPKDGRYLYIGRFTPAFVDMVKKHVNIKDLPIAMNYRDAYISMESKENGRYKGEGINYHNLGINGMKSAIESFGNPEQVLLSKKEGKIELVLEGVDYKGDRILSIVALNTSAQNAQKFIEAHIVTSIYGRRSIDKYVEKAESEGRLIYSKKEELVQGIPQVQYEGDINTDSSSVVNVSQPAEKVNKNSERTGGGSSNRDLLASAFEGITQNSEEYKLIQEYKGRIKLINEYEEKLYKINEQIREITFGTSGKRDTKKLQQLQAEAKELAGHINRNDRKLLNLEASEPLRRVIDRERMKASQKTREHVNEILQNKKVRAEQTELRHKIRKTIMELKKILNHGNKKRNVKEGMRDFVETAIASAEVMFMDNYSEEDMIRNGVETDVTAEENRMIDETRSLLRQRDDLFNTDRMAAEGVADVSTGDVSDVEARTEASAKLDRQIAKNMRQLKGVFERERNRIHNATVTGMLDNLAKAYRKLGESDDLYIRGAVDENVYQKLKSLGEDMEGNLVRDLDLEQLDKLHDAYKMVLHTVREANTLFAEGKAKSLQQTADDIALELGSRNIPTGKAALIAQKAANKLGWNYEKLYYALDRIGSKTFTELINRVADSEDTVMRDAKEAHDFLLETVKKYGYNNWKVNRELDRVFKDSTGREFKLTLGQMMALYAYSRRKNAWNHIQYGGFVFGKAALTNPRPADSYKLTREQCEAITNLLTPEQKAYADEMQKYLSEVMGAKGNEVSMKLYGIEMFKEKNYFPIHVAGQFQAKAQEAKAKEAEGFGSMSNTGFTQTQNPNAKAPFVLEAFNEVWADHVNEMARYHGAVPALEDLRRVMNRSAYLSDTESSTSIKQIMENHYGKEAVDYFDNLYREANSGAVYEKLQKLPKKLLGLFRKNSVAYSLSVLVQQPASIVRAYAMVDRKYFGIKGVGAISSGAAKAIFRKKVWEKTYAEMVKYAPGVTLAKEIGGFDTASGGSIRQYLLDTGKNFRQQMKTGTVTEKAGAAMNLVDDNKVANLPNVADKIAWMEIWNACKRETVHNNPSLSTGSEEFMEKVGQRFTEVIRATQVYDSIFAKSPMLKSKNMAVQAFVSFMNEPNTTANMVESALRDFGRKQGKLGLRKLHVILHSIIFTGVMKSIIYAMRDDDEDETFVEKYMESLTGSILDDVNPANYIPLARDAWSALQGYDVERSDMAIVADAADALVSVIKNAQTDTENMTEAQLVAFDQKCTDASWRLAEAIAAFLGIPVKNVRREINAILNTAKNAYAKSGKTTWKSVWYKIQDAALDSNPFVDTPDKTEKLYRAVTSGDAQYRKRFEDTYESESELNSALRKALRTHDPRVREAAKAMNSGDNAKYRKLLKEITGEGHFSGENIEAAIQAEAEKLAVQDFTQAHPEVEGITYAAVKAYKEATNVPADVFYDAWQYKSGRKKEEVLGYIDGLELTRKQKDALYLAFGWAESKLDEAPWN